MATIRPSIPHEDRTAAEPRENQLEPVILSYIREVNENVRLLRLSAVQSSHVIKVGFVQQWPGMTLTDCGPVKFFPGQWIDTFIPGLPRAGGFTITSTPSEARPQSHSSAYLELAVQKSNNPPAQWLWQPHQEILNKQLVVRVGGSFTWPPQRLDPAGIDRLVLVAGGVGINPLISIFSHLVRSPRKPQEIHFVYGTRASAELDAQSILFLPRLMDLIAAANDPNVTLSLYLTDTGDSGSIEHGKFPNRTFGRRMTERDLIHALDGHKETVYGAEYERQGTVCYVCGPPKMTDQVVAFLSSQPGMAKERVLCEKWW